MLAPLLIKYKTKSKNYLYDCGTGRIIEVDDVIYTVVDDFRYLTDLEMLIKYADLGIDRVRLALEELYDLRQHGYLADHHPAELSPVDIVSYRSKREQIGSFWQRTAGLLILGITERCNLCCSYCCFSGEFSGQRTHSQRSMSREVAEKAIRYFLETDQIDEKLCPISFYGGEPLLEFSLMKRCVEFAETQAAELSKKARFAITTNGTLLEDDVVDFLVEHEFLILVSLDGPQTLHDRYRVFPDGSGSFERIHANLVRFAARYPDYKQRGLNVILAPPFDLDGTVNFIESFYDDYPLTRVSLVNTGTDQRFDDDTSPTQYGCYSAALCKKNIDLNQDSFRNFKPDDYRQLRSRWEACMDSITRFGVVRSRKTMLFETLLFEQQIAFYHTRHIDRKPSNWYFFIPCVPGLTRRFCDVDGNYRVCERVDDSETYRLGNVWDGPDIERLRRTMELRRHFGDCANCSAMRTCDICYARIPDSDAVDKGFDPLFDRQCQQTRKVTRRMLQTYTEIMEVNPHAFDKPTNETSKGPKMKFGTLNHEQRKTLLSQMECEEMT